MKITKTFISALIRAPTPTLSKLSEDDIAAVIQYANHHYYSSGQPCMDDGVYDMIKDRLEKINPKHPILHAVGSYVDDGDVRKEKLPYWMGSMDKIKADNSALASFIKTHRSAGAAGAYVVSDKLDGVSGLFHYRDGEAQLFTRGDGEVGQNVSHLLPFISGIPALPLPPPWRKGGVTVRGELIISKSDFEKIKHKGANARNTVSGIVNAKMPDLQVAKHVNFVGYSVYHPEMKQSAQHALIRQLGFRSVFHRVVPERQLTFDTLSDTLVQRRSASEFEIDGIIVQHDSISKLVRGKNPSSGFAFKNIITQETAEVVVTNVEWGVSKDGFYKPVVEFEGVRLSGVVIRRATGHNGAYIHANTIGPGARILITRSGDVIPYIVKVVTPSSSGHPQMPDKEYKWTATRKDIEVVGKSEEHDLRLLENFFDKLAIKGLARGTVKRIYDAGFTDVVSVLSLTQPQVNSIPGLTNKSVFLETLRARLATLPCTTLMEASNAWGRGFGERKFKAILARQPDALDPARAPNFQDLVDTAGVSTITANAFLQGLARYHEFIRASKLVCVRGEQGKGKGTGTGTGKGKGKGEGRGTEFAGQHIVFTGFRNKECEDFITDNGGHVSTTVSGKTTLVVTKDPGSASAKIVKAREKGIRIAAFDEFRRACGLNPDPPKP